MLNVRSKLWPTPWLIALQGFPPFRSLSCQSLPFQNRPFLKPPRPRIRYLPVLWRTWMALLLPPLPLWRQATQP